SPIVHDFRDFFVEGKYMDAGFELSIRAILDWARQRHGAWYNDIETALREVRLELPESRLD
ncbi:MAG TPA: hypothetical protein VK760_09160, partial [Candidatus Acidoferrales bacterium]|nr:hypothetical protein [Candidatus Acidoferrales bacterium]